MCDPVLGGIMVGTQVLGGIQQKNAADSAAAAAQAAGEFNAQIIERDIDLLERQRSIVNENFLVSQNRAASFFERDVQGTARAGFGFAGVDMSMGTPLEVLRDNAREFDYEQAVNEFNNKITNLQISDAQEEAELNAQLSRMQGGASAAGLRAQGTGSLIRSFGAAAGAAYETGLFAQ